MGERNTQTDLYMTLVAKESKWQPAVFIFLELLGESGIWVDKLVGWSPGMAAPWIPSYWAVYT
jgi:hypothetical protein